MQVYQSRYSKLPGTSQKEAVRQARLEYHAIQRRTPRRNAYVRSKYFGKSKIFINQFWDHLKQKRLPDQLRRLKLYSCALDLIRNSTLEPTTKEHPDKTGELVHRFLGITAEGELFFVQIKENRHTDRKDFMSVFPYDGKVDQLKRPSAG